MSTLFFGYRSAFELLKSNEKGCCLDSSKTFELSAEFAATFPASRPCSGAIYDRLFSDVPTDCGQNWIQRFYGDYNSPGSPH